MTGIPKDTLRVELSRLVARGVVRRLAREWYANPFSPPSVEEVAMVLRWPSYVSLEYALSVESILSQTAFTITCVTLKLPVVIRTPWGPIFEYHRISRRFFWGWRDLGNGVRAAWPEKALLDLIYIRHLRTRELNEEDLASMLEDMYLEDLDMGRLREFIGGFGSPYGEKMAAVLMGTGRVNL
ncbi:Transcriptional regulator, AbiEi antitoxin, Type IV TA system [Thermanaeromonas toyohensis ToBE]|uniref:Transcriptional regulator, AbiEi antitoxin, Type IV TA system n=2 Tax=Thermanaeromonas TaxID=202949 RepID=A0A1W1VRU5_9FIRM|nr:Transcriptional regulator, AbiEi antitoxin, Type IV TA system [Thermanaeromonas toyohensis ToBE]